MFEGIAVNLISAALGALILAFAFRIAIPWYQRAVYHGPHLGGTWHCRYDSSQLPDDQVMEATQYGSWIKGKVTVNRWADGSIANLEVPVTGRIVGHQVILVGVHAASGTSGATLLEIREAATQLIGFVVTAEPSSNQVRSFPRKWIRMNVTVPS